MTAFIIFLLFLLNIVTIFAVIVLFLRQNRLLAAEQKQKQGVKEIEELMNGFMLEMKEQNDLLMEKISSYSKTQINETYVNKKDADARSKRKSGQDSQSKVSQQKYKPNKKAIAAYQPNLATIDTKEPAAISSLEKDIVDKVEISSASTVADPVPKSTETTETSEINEHESFKEALIQEMNKDNISLPEQVSKMHDDGMTVEEIAKELNRGKTEIELLLKFRI
jgi:hypothetical protein